MASVAASVASAVAGATTSAASTGGSGEPRGALTAGALRQRSHVVAPASQPPDEEQPPQRPPDDNRHRGRCSSCCYRFLGSRCFKAITLSIVSVVPLYGFGVALPTLLERCQCTGWFCMLRHWIFATWVSVQFLYNFGMSQFVDPGGTLGLKPAVEATGQFELSLGSAGDKVLFAPNWCETCQYWKPPRSHHCSFCQRCVLRMDHHCPWVGNCIGMRNHGHFFLMYVYSMLGLFYCLGLCFWVVHRDDGGRLQRHESVPYVSPGIAGFMAYLCMQVLVAAGPELGFFVIFAGVALVVVLSFGCPALYFALVGRTMLEHQFPLKEYVQLQPQVYCPLGPGFFQHRWWQNVRLILGPHWAWRLLLPLRGGVPDVAAALVPVAGSQGAEALRRRIAEVQEGGAPWMPGTWEQLGLHPGPGTVGGSAADAERPPQAGGADQETRT